MILHRMTHTGIACCQGHSMACCITASHCRSVSRRFGTTPEVSGQFGYVLYVTNSLGTEVSWSRSVRKAWSAYPS